MWIGTLAGIPGDAHVAVAQRVEGVDDRIAVARLQGREEGARVDVGADPVERSDEALAAVVAQVLPELLIGLGRLAVHPVEADLEIAEAPPTSLLLGGGHALDQR